MKTFHIVTIFNNMEQYSQMKLSFESAGFVDQNCAFTAFDNSVGNDYEPYSAFNSILDNCEEPYVIFCHQDVVVKGGSSFDHLMGIICDLEKADPRWSLAGNAGCPECLVHVRRITDPHGGDMGVVQLPQKVLSLDENFFILKKNSGLKFSCGLSGFHLYANDLCLSALLDGRSAYVIDFHLIHLSGGNYDTDDFRESRANFQSHWQNKFLFIYFPTPCTIVFLSRFAIVRRVCNSNRGTRLFVRRRKARIFLERMALNTQLFMKGLPKRGKCLKSA
jgi:hypothetical protein